MKIVIDFFFFNFECSSITKALLFSSESLIGSILSLFPLCYSLSKVILEILNFFLKFLIFNDLYFHVKKAWTTPVIKSFYYLLFIYLFFCVPSFNFDIVSFWVWSHGHNKLFVHSVIWIWKNMGTIVLVLILWVLIIYNIIFYNIILITEHGEEDDFYCLFY